MVPVRDPTLASSSLGLDQQLTPLQPAKQINGTLPSYNSMRLAPMLNSDHANDPEVGELIDASVGNANATPNASGTTEGNDEAAMAVIMSLLEADAGLGGPVDFSGLPWPLP
uniref:CSON003702 protein n=1 Tax=Culicoides sonorensis TaxID=179676 RepID=A0A336LIZ9_CULSO